MWTVLKHGVIGLKRKGLNVGAVLGGYSTKLGETDGIPKETITNLKAKVARDMVDYLRQMEKALTPFLGGSEMLYNI